MARAIRGQRLWVVLLLLSLSLSACERKPEDLEKWRNAKGGTEKMMQWAKSKKEPMPVRKRAVEILLEQNESIKLPPLLDDIKDEKTRQELAGACVPIIEKLWEAQDFPKLDEKLKTEGGQIKVSDSKAVRAKDAAYYLHPYVNEADRAKLEKILTEWLKEDHILRDQLGRTTLGQILPRAGKSGFAGMMVWFETADNPGQVAREIRRHADENTKKEFAKKVFEVADKKHPEISDELSTVILETEDEIIIPYLERAIMDEKSPAVLVDDATDALVRLSGPKASIFFTKLIAEQQGLRRWVAVTRMIELRGKDGVIQGANALPLETDKYVQGVEGGFGKESSIFCNFVKSSYEEKKLGEFEPEIKKLLTSSRWPAQALGLRCVEKHKLTGLKAEVEALSTSTQAIPGWAAEPKTVGDVAKEIAATL